MKNFFAAVGILLLTLTVSAPVNADVMLTLAAAPGTDLFSVHVGDTLIFHTIASSTDAGESFISFPEVHILGSGFFDSLSGVLASTWSAPLDSNPLLAIWTVHVNGAGPAELYNGWPACTGLPGDPTGCAVTNLGASRPADSNHLLFTVQAATVAEPGSLALLGIGLLLLVGATLPKRSGDNSWG